MTSQWWSVAAKKLSLPRRNKDKGYDHFDPDDEEDDGESEKMEYRFPLLVGPDGQIQKCRISPRATVGELVEALTKRKHYGIIRRDFDEKGRLCGRDILDEDRVLGDIKIKRWSPKKASECEFVLVDLSKEVTVFFNARACQLLGEPRPFLRFYPQPGTTVKDLETMVKEALKLNSDDARFSLYGSVANEMHELKPGCIIGDLMEKEAEFENEFFQFQVRPEADDQATQQIDVAAQLFMRPKSLLKPQREYYIKVQGTTLFYSQHEDFSKPNKIENLQQCQVSGFGGKDGIFKFYLQSFKEDQVLEFSGPGKDHLAAVFKAVRRLSGRIPDRAIPISMVEITRDFPDAFNEPAYPVPYILPSRGLLGEMVEAELLNIELHGAALQLNGIDRIETGYYKKWLHSVYCLLWICSDVVTCKSGLKVSVEIQQIQQKLLYIWTNYFFKAGVRRVIQPSYGSYEELVNACRRLVTAYHAYMADFREQYARGATLTLYGSHKHAVKCIQLDLSKEFKDILKLKAQPATIIAAQAEHARLLSLLPQPSRSAKIVNQVKGSKILKTGKINKKEKDNKALAERMERTANPQAYGLCNSSVENLVRGMKLDEFTTGDANRESPVETFARPRPLIANSDSSFLDIVRASSSRSEPVRSRPQSPHSISSTGRRSHVSQRIIPAHHLDSSTETFASATAAVEQLDLHSGQISKGSDGTGNDLLLSLLNDPRLKKKNILERMFDDPRFQEIILEYFPSGGSSRRS